MDELRDWWNWPKRGALPAWVLSLSLHFTVVTTLGLGVQTKGHQAPPVATRDGSIVLVARSSGKSEYFSDQAGADANPPVVLATPAAPPMMIGVGLPSASEPDAPATLPVSVSASADMTPGGRGKTGPAARGQDQATETQVFGVRGRGSRFVYVFDRSSSMEGGPLAAAKRELIASLQSLQSVHQFQIIFYNEQPQLMPSFRGHSPQMVYGNESGKRLAANFVGGVLPYGATDHLLALQTALQMRPDIVFFLTDANEPQLHASDFEKIRRLNQGTTINAIEFGMGPPKVGLSFLQQLAAENGGQHTYVDITRLLR